jgi:hypothetical protein
MNKGIDHFKAAEEDTGTAHVVDEDRAGYFLARAQIHATLAVAQAIREGNEK